MKKLVILGIVMFLLTGCGTSGGSSNNTSKNNSANNTANKNELKNKDKLDASNLEIKEFKLEDTEYENTRYLLSVKNKSKDVGEVYVNATAYDANNQVIGSADSTIDVLGAEEESFLFLYFDGVTGIDHIDYKNNLQFNAKTYYQPVLSKLDVQGNTNGNVLALVAKNNNDFAVEYVEAYAVFMDANNNPLQMSSTYIGDSNDQIEAGATQSAQIEYYSDYDKGAYDHVTWFLSGRAEK